MCSKVTQGQVMKGTELTSTHRRYLTQIGCACEVLGLWSRRGAVPTYRVPSLEPQFVVEEWAVWRSRHPVVKWASPAVSQVSGLHHHPVRIHSVVPRNLQEHPEVRSVTLLNHMSGSHAYPFSAYSLYSLYCWFGSR